MTKEKKKGDLISSVKKYLLKTFLKHQKLQQNKLGAKEFMDVY